MPDSQQKQGLNVSVKSFVTAIAVIFVLMVLSYILTFLIPGGSYARSLDENGNAQTDLRTNVGKPNPRCAIGYYEPGHYCFVVVDGRQSDWSWGLTMDDLSLLMHNLGCKVAYNLDGGSTAQLYFEGGIYNRPCHTDREISDIVYIAKATPAPTEEPTETDAP